jgi:hypothetical protein
MSGDIINIKVYFSGDQSQFYEIDKEFMLAQLANIEIVLRSDPNSDIYDGFGGTFQKINFTMPNSDFELVIKEKDYRYALSVSKHET